MEKTLAIVKPDGVSRGIIGEVVKRIEANGLKIIAMKLIHMTRPQAQGFYAVHKERPFLKASPASWHRGPPW
jgi:nucleoside-diphosphate kinase